MQRRFHQNGELRLIANAPRPTLKGGFFDQVVAVREFKGRSAATQFLRVKGADQSTDRQIFRQLQPETGGLAHETQRAASTAERT